MYTSLGPSPPPQLSSLAVSIMLIITLRVIRTASDNSCGGGPGTRLHVCNLPPHPPYPKYTYFFCNSSTKADFVVSKKEDKSSCLLYVASPSGSELNEKEILQWLLLHFAHLSSPKMYRFVEFQTPYMYTCSKQHTSVHCHMLATSQMFAYR